MDQCPKCGWKESRREKAKRMILEWMKYKGGEVEHSMLMRSMWRVVKAEELKGIMEEMVRMKRVERNIGDRMKVSYKLC